MTEVIFAYVTTKDMGEADKIAAAIVGERLAACANILPGMKSVYHWEGRVEHTEETVVLLKTREDLFPALEKRVKELHSFKTPCIVSLPAEKGSADYFDWIMKETRSL